MKFNESIIPWCSKIIEACFYYSVVELTQTYTAHKNWAKMLNLLLVSAVIILNQGSANCGPQSVNLQPASTFLFEIECGP